MNRLILINAMICTNTNQMEKRDLHIENGKIIAWQKPHDILPDDQVIDLKGCLLTPGLVDIHVHLREPGQTHKETIKTGTQAAARGGFTRICAMPNTLPVPDSEETMRALMELIQRDACIRVHPYAPITTRLVSTECVDQSVMLNLGVVGFTNDGVGVQSASTMFDAMLEAKRNNTVIVAHAEDDTLKRHGVVHEGEVSSRLQLPGILAVSESAQVARDLVLAEASGARYHVCHVSSAQTVRLIKEAKANGINVSAEVSPHHLLLDESSILCDDANFKMNPPLRSKNDRIALINGLKDGTIDCIASDHAPHSVNEKELGMMQAPFGIIGLEHAFGLLYTVFVVNEVFTLGQLIDWMSSSAAKVLNLESNRLELNQVADLAVFDLENDYIITHEFKSKSKNSPFIGRTIKGNCIMTIHNGKIVWSQI